MICGRELVMKVPVGAPAKVAASELRRHDRLSGQRRRGEATAYDECGVRGWADEQEVGG
jgi:hypothetical protein